MRPGFPKNSSSKKLWILLGTSFPKKTLSNKMKGPNLAQHVPQVNCCFSCKRKKLTYDPGPSFSKQFFFKQKKLWIEQWLTKKKFFQQQQKIPTRCSNNAFRWLITAYFLKEKKTHTRLSKKIFFKPKKIVHHWLGLAFQKILF